MLKKVSLIILVVCSIALCSCAKKELPEPDASLNTVRDDKIVDSEPITNDFDILQEEVLTENELLVKMVKIIINDELWYNGVDSKLIGFEDFKTDYTVYKSSKVEDVVNIIFSSPVTNGGYSDLPEYFSIQLIYDDSEYKRKLNGFYSDTSLEELEKKVMQDGFEFYLEGSIEFSSVEKPVFTSLDESKEEVLDIIQQLTVDRLKEWGKTGEYILHIKDFDDYNDTVVVIENDGMKKWVLEVWIKDMQAMGTNKFLVVGYDISEFSANQYATTSYTRQVEIR